MPLKIFILIINLTLAFPVSSAPPTTAIEWLQDRKPLPKKIPRPARLYKTIPDNIIIPITTTTLKPNNFNSIGIIPSEITGINPRIWSSITEDAISFQLNSLPYLHFSTARTFLKRVLITETNAPLDSLTSIKKGKLYLFSKLDKLIEIGALDEAETLISLVPKLDKDVFNRWSKVSLLTGRLTKMCKTLVRKPELSSDLSLRIICFARLGDWQAAALILATASTLGKISNNREQLLIRYLDPNLFIDNQTNSQNSNFDEIDFYIKTTSQQYNGIRNNKPKYSYRELNSNSSLDGKIIAAEILTISKSINGSVLFDIYRNSIVDKSEEHWTRIETIQDLDSALNTVNKLKVSTALKHAISEMHSYNLLVPFAKEYAAKLSYFDAHANQTELNDEYATIFVLANDLPDNWTKYKAKNEFINLALDVLKQRILTPQTIEMAIQLTKSKQKYGKFDTSKENNTSNKKPMVQKSRGSDIMESLRLSANGTRTTSQNLYESLITLIKINELALAKSLLIEYLIGYSRNKI